MKGGIDNRGSGIVTAKGLRLDHALPRACGVSDDETNLITLCGICHGNQSDRGVWWSAGVVAAAAEDCLR